MPVQRLLGTVKRLFGGGVVRGFTQEDVSTEFIMKVEVLLISYLLSCLSFSTSVLSGMYCQAQ